tara:strand:+ start:420 stop:866 length:447 start_codon:yes stop_codon:yes gene_type:complete
MKHRHTVSAMTLAVFVLLAIGSTDTEESIETDISSGNESQSGSESSVAVRVTATQLFADYEANEVSADEKYKGKAVLVSGTIENIGKDLLDTMYVSLKTDNPIIGVQCMFSDEHKSQLANAAKGQRVTIKGKCDGKLGNVLLRGCSFE